MRLTATAIRQRISAIRRLEDGYAMIAMIGAMVLVTGLVAAAVAATQGDLNLTKRDIDDKRSYSAAQAGIADYSFHLNNDNGYWARCTTVPSPNAVNQMGSTTRKRAVPGVTDASYAIELIPKEGQSTCSTSNPVGTMLESSGINTGSFRIRSTGFVGDTKASIVATFKRASLLDYIYFTQFETSDPVTYGYSNPSAELTDAYTQCSKFLGLIRENRPSPTGWRDYCNHIVFVSSDQIEGPLHTNDILQICGSPTFGRSPADVIEVSSPPQGVPPRGWISRCGGSDAPNFVGPLVTTAPVLTPPPTNGKLKAVAGPVNTNYHRSCQTRIVLNGTQMDVWVGSTLVNDNLAFPPGGVFYVANGNSSCSPSPCTTSYSPFTATYPTATQCGNVIVRGTYSGQLTIAAENDIIIEEDITRTGSGVLGLIANNFVRVKHPCSGGTNQTGTPANNLRVDAALLAIQHSFIVDHYDCGATLGELEVNGAISQKWRGPVGTIINGSINHGYYKDYNYDDRLRYQEPPNFLDPVQSAWHIQRETIDFP